eukprot:4911675-Alexandrium_andersonii.AAC.1
MLIPTGCIPRLARKGLHLHGPARARNSRRWPALEAPIGGVCWRPLASVECDRRSNSTLGWPLRDNN